MAGQRTRTAVGVAAKNAQVIRQGVCNFSYRLPIAVAQYVSTEVSGLSEQVIR
jgi:hypothetical protein